jgi:hypothetical protein
MGITSYGSGIRRKTRSDMPNMKMTFCHQTRRAMAQAITSASEDAARKYVYKHVGMLASQMPPIRSIPDAGVFVNHLSFQSRRNR